MPSRDWHEGNGSGVVTDLLDESGHLLLDLLEPGLGVGGLGGVHLVDGHDELLNTQGVGKKSKRRRSRSGSRDRSSRKRESKKKSHRRRSRDKRRSRSKSRSRRSSSTSPSPPRQSGASSKQGPTRVSA